MFLDLKLGRLAGATALGVAACGALPRVQTEARDLSLTLLPEVGPVAASSTAEHALLYPRLTGAGDQLVLSWTEVQGEQRWGLRASRLLDGEWSSVMHVAEGDDWFVNWADFPSVVASSAGLFAHWLVRDVGGPYAYHVEYATSRSGDDWSAPRWLHDDRSAVEHGFVTTLGLGDGFFSAWLDGRVDDSMKLIGRGSALSSESELGDEIELDGKTCSCCPTAAVQLNDGSVLVAYRDRSATEVRDIALVRGLPGDPGSWTEARIPHADGWLIPGCPVNGPALAVGRERVALAWFTMGDDEKPRVQVAFSDDGTSFGWAMPVDDGLPAGRVSIAALPGRDAFVVGWLELVDDTAQWRVRLLEPGAEHASQVLADVTGARPDGMLSLAAGVRDVIAAWTDVRSGSIGLMRIARE